MIQIETFKNFVDMYRTQYGQKWLPRATANMWYQQLKHMDEMEFGECVTKLLGDKDYRFVWGEIIKKHAVLFPKTGEIKKMEEEWKAQASSKGQILMGCMNGLIKQKHWRKAFARRMLEVFGEEEYNRQKAMFMNDPEYREFALVMGEIQ